MNLKGENNYLLSINMTTATPERTISIMAGNPRVEVHGDGSIVLDPHLEAFDAALRLATETRDHIGGIYVAFDHIGRFRDHFVRSDISARSRRKPILSDCVPEITEIYRPLADRHGIPLENIGIITEESARVIMLALHPTLASPFDRIAGSMARTICEKECRIGEKVDEEPEDRLRITCKGITAAIIERLARHGDDIHLFWEYDPVRCKPFTITGGIILAEKIFPLHGKRVTNTMIFRMQDGSSRSITT